MRRAKVGGTPVRDATLQRMDDRVSDLVRMFSHYAEVFDRANLFTGPSLYFHHRTLALLKKNVQPSEATRDEEFAVSLYATLTAWGVHRMGPGNAKLVDFDTFSRSLGEHRAQVKDLEGLNLAEVSERSVMSIAALIWDLIADLQVSASKTKLVAGTKVLHHLLPDLVPPVDREYTLRFFLHSTSLQQGGQERAWGAIFPRFWHIARECKKEITARLGSGMNTSLTKVIDNAIVGYVLRQLKPRE